MEDSTDDGSSSDDDSSAISLLERINSTSTCVVSFQVCYRDFTRRSHFEKFVQAFGSQNTLNIENQIKKNRASVYEILVLNMLIASIDISKCAFFN